MNTLRNFIREAFDKGGVMVAGFGCLYLFRKEYAPEILGPLSYGLISVGAIGFAKYFIMDYRGVLEREDYQRLLNILDQRKLEIEANREKLEELRAACESFMAMRETLEGWRRDPSLVQDKVTILEELLKKRDCGTSLLVSKGESTQGTISGVSTEHCSSTPSRKDSDMTLVDVGETVPKYVECEIQKDMQEEKLEGINKKVEEEVMDYLLVEVSEEVLEEESAKLLKDISGDVQKEMHKRMQKELPESRQLEVSEKSMEEIMEKVQKDLYENLQESTEEISETFEVVQDLPEEELVVLEESEDSKAELKQSQTDEEDKDRVKDCKEDISRKGMQSEDESEALLPGGSKNQKDNESKEILQFKLGNISENIEEQKKRVITPEFHLIEPRSQEQIEMDLEEALLESESKGQ